MTPEEIAALTPEQRAELQSAFEAQALAKSTQEAQERAQQMAQYRANLKIAKNSTDPMVLAQANKVLKQIDMATGNLYREEISPKALTVGNRDLPYAELLMARRGPVLHNTLFQFTDYRMSEDADYLLDDHEFSINDVQAADAEQRKYAGKCQ